MKLDGDGSGNPHKSGPSLGVEPDESCVAPPLFTRLGKGRSASLPNGVRTPGNVRILDKDVGRLKADNEWYRLEISLDRSYGLGD